MEPGVPLSKTSVWPKAYALALFLILVTFLIVLGKRNLGRTYKCPSFRLSIRPTCERDILRTASPIDFKFEIYQTTGNTDAIDFGPSARNKMAAIELLNLIRDVIPRTDAIDFGPSDKIDCQTKSPKDRIARTLSPKQSRRLCPVSASIIYHMYGYKCH